MESIKLIENSNVLAWIVQNGLVNENGERMEFDNYRYLIDPYTDNSPFQAVMKCAQIGWSTLGIFRDFHLAGYSRANVIHTLPSKTIVKDFVKPKVDRIISQNPAIAEMMGETDSIALKSVGERFVYYRGTWDEGQAISISAHVLIHDEYDRSNQGVLEVYSTRLGATKRDRPDLGYIWCFSNPTTPNFGVHKLYLQSDQKRWFVRCEECRRWQDMVWPDSVDFERGIYVCRHCGGELSDEDRRMGKWIARYPGRRISGYHVHKMMVPFVPATDLIDASKGDPTIFHNFWLGLPYSDPQITVNREAIINAVVLTENPAVDNVLGVDNGVVKHWVLGNQWGIFRYGATKDWREIDQLIREYNAITVIDAEPHSYYPLQLVKKYSGRVFAHWFSRDTKNIGTVRWGEGDERGRVLVDRSRMLDALATEIVGQEITFNIPPNQLEPLITHVEAVYRTVIKDKDGRERVEWLTQGSAPDHWFFALELWRVGMEKRKLSGRGGPIKPQRPGKKLRQGLVISKYGFGEDIVARAPGYDYKKKFDQEAKRKRKRDQAFSPKRTI